MDFTFYMVGRFVHLKGASEPAALRREYFDIAFTDGESADQFIRVQQVAHAFVEPVSGPVPEPGNRIMLKRETDTRHFNSLVPTNQNAEALRVDPWVLEAQHGLSLWHIEVQDGTYHVQRAYSAGKLCNPLPLPSSNGGVHASHDKTAKRVDIHLFAPTEESALALAQGFMSQPG